MALPLSWDSKSLSVWGMICLIVTTGCTPSEVSGANENAPSMKTETATMTNSAPTSARTATVAFTKVGEGVVAEVTSNMQFGTQNQRLVLAISDVKVFASQIKRGSNLYTVVFRPFPLETFNAIPDGAPMGVVTELGFTLGLDAFGVFDRNLMEVK